MAVRRAAKLEASQIMKNDEVNLDTSSACLNEKRDPEAGLELRHREASTSTVGTAAEPFPDGGLRAWLVVLGGFWTVFCGFGLANASGGFQTLYRESILSEYSASQISWIIAAQAFFTFSPAIFTGSLFDRYGHRPLVATGGILLALGFAMLSLSSQYYQIFLCHATLIAWGCNLLFICPLAVIGQWFDKRRGLAFGLCSCGSSLGAVVWPLVLANAPAKIGFGWTCRILTLISCFCGVCSFFLLKTRLPPKPKGSFFFWPAFKNLEYDLIVVNFWTFTFGFFSFTTYIGTYGAVQGFGSFAPYLLIISNGSSIIGRLGSGILADYIGVYNVVWIGNLILAVTLWAWLACSTIPSCVALVIILGVASGAFVALQAPLATATATDMRVGGTMLGQAIFVQSFASLICSPIFGAVLGNGSSQQTLDRFPHAIALGASVMVAGLAVLSAARYMRAPKLITKV